MIPLSKLVAQTTPRAPHTTSFSMGTHSWGAPPPSPIHPFSPTTATGGDGSGSGGKRVRRDSEDTGSLFDHDSARYDFVTEPHLTPA